MDREAWCAEWLNWTELKEKKSFLIYHQKSITTINFSHYLIYPWISNFYFPGSWVSSLLLYGILFLDIKDSSEFWFSRMIYLIHTTVKLSNQCQLKFHILYLWVQFLNSNSLEYLIGSFLHVSEDLVSILYLKAQTTSWSKAYEVWMLNLLESPIVWKWRKTKSLIGAQECDNCWLRVWSKFLLRIREYYGEKWTWFSMSFQFILVTYTIYAETNSFAYINNI